MIARPNATSREEFQDNQLHLQFQKVTRKDALSHVLPMVTADQTCSAAHTGSYAWTEILAPLLDQTAMPIKTEEPHQSPNPNQSPNQNHHQSQNQPQPQPHLNHLNQQVVMIISRNQLAQPQIPDHPSVILEKNHAQLPSRDGTAKETNKILPTTLVEVKNTKIKPSKASMLFSGEVT